MNPFKVSPVTTIVMAQLLGTSLWFSPNSAADSLMLHWGLGTAQIGQLTSATQVGFILGTLFIASSGVADRYLASRIFVLSCVFGASFNAWFAWGAPSFEWGLVLRFLVGVTLAGIYPLGMKLVISWSNRHAGTTLALLVGMLILGSALPHAVRALGVSWMWQSVVLTSSLLAFVGGIAVFILGDGPHLPKATRQPLVWGAALNVFANPDLRASAMGYFGHMWELYAFWTLIPWLVVDVFAASTITPDTRLVATLSFVIMGLMGAGGAILAGFISPRFGSPRVAAVALLTSGVMCLLYPVIPDQAWPLKLAALIVWGLTVASDSAQFSATSAKLCPPHLVGGALAIQNSVGFLISVFSISWVMSQYDTLGNQVTWYLLPGPLLGLIFFRRLVFRSKPF